MRVFQPQRTGDEAINRNLDALLAQLKSVGDMQAIFGKGGGKPIYPTSSLTVDDESLVLFRGTVAATLTLPGVLSLGNGVVRQLVIINGGTATLTVVAGPGDGLSGSASVVSGVKSLWFADGEKTWHRVV